MNRLSSLLLPLGVLMVAPSALAQVQTSNAPMTRLEQDTARALNVVRASVIEMEIEGAPGSSASAHFSMDGENHLLLLEPHSNRSENFQVLKDIGNGELVEVTPDVLRTYRGQVLDIPGATVTAGWQEDGLYAEISMPDGTSRWIEPVGLHIEGATQNSHAVYRGADVIAVENGCGVDESFRQESQAFADSTASLGDEPKIAFGSALLVAELACDADFEYFQDWGSVAGVQNRIETVINGINGQYESEVGVTHEITTIIVRTNAADPYTSNNANTLLTQFQIEWNSNQGGVQRDVAHLFTGRNIIGGTIGIAFLGVICNLGLAYGLVESDCCGGFAVTTDLSAHELGHNWNADHCACAFPSFTMNPSLTGANRFSPTATIPGLIAYANSRPCLDIDNPTPPGPLAIAGLSPTSVPVVNPDSTVVISLTGSGFVGVTDVLVNGTPLLAFPPQFAVQDDNNMTVNLSAPLSLGNTTIQLIRGAETANASVPIVFNTEPTLDLASTGPFLLSALPIDIFMGSQPGQVHFLLFSTTAGSSVIPGLLDLDIGNNLTNLFLLGDFPIDAATGFAQLTASISGVAPGTPFFFQSAVFDPTQPFAALVSSGVESSTVLF